MGPEGQRIPVCGHHLCSVVVTLERTPGLKRSLFKKVQQAGNPPPRVQLSHLLPLTHLTEWAIGAAQGGWWWAWPSTDVAPEPDWDQFSAGVGPLHRLVPGAVSQGDSHSPDSRS